MARSILTRSLLCLLPTIHAATLLASHFEGTVYSLSLSDDASELTLASQVSVGGMPSWLTLDKAVSTLYVTDESWLGGTKLSAWSVGEGGELTAAGEAPTQGGELHSCLFGGEDGESFVAAAQYDAGGIITFQLPLSPSSTTLDAFKYTMDGPGPVPDRQNQPHPHSTFTDPTGAFLLSADLGADVIRIFSIGDSGALTECPTATASPGTGPRHGAFWTPDEETTVLYVVNELGNSVTSWDVTYGDCLSLTENQIVPTYPEDTTPPPGSKAAEIIIRDNFLYATNRFDKTFGQTSDSIALFEITGSGDFSFVELADSGANFPRTFDINAAGDMIAVGGQTSSDVVILERDATSGKIGSVLAKLQIGQLGAEQQEDGLSAVIWVE